MTRSNDSTAAEPSAAGTLLVDLSTTASSRRYDLSSWDISELLPDASEESIAQRVQSLEEGVERFEGQRDSLSPDMDPDAFFKILQDYEALLEDIDILAGYANLWFSSDTQSTQAIAFRNRVRQVLAQLQNRFIFFELWWQGLDDEQAERLRPQEETDCDPQRLVDYRHYLEELRRFKPYTLDERSEQLINTKNTNGIDAVVTLYSMLTNRLEFDVDLPEEGRQTLTEGEMRSLFYSPDPKVRVQVYDELFRVYEQEATILAQIYANRVRDWHNEYVQLRGIQSPISVRNLWNDVPDAAVETLLDVVHANAHIFHDYFRMKGEWLGFSPLRRYDLYAPLASTSQNVDYGEAIDNVLTTFRNFDPRFADLAEKVVAEKHLDAEIRKGKRSGAFCATILPRFTPWVLVNYTGKVRDISTLAHELGHAIHSMLASDHSVLTQHPSLPLAETASVFAEMLMTDRLLAQEQDPVTRREILAAAVDDVYATVMRQAYFVRFEVAAHEAILANKSSDDLFDIYAETIRQQFGDSMDIAPQFRYEWVSIPHFFNTPFYCYAYSFGQLLVLALYRRYQQEGDAFKPGYFRLLSYGGSARPETILRELGIDITDAAFWQGGFDVVRSMIAELKSIDVP